MITMTKRFYKIHSAIQAPKILSLYSEALEEAKKCIAEGKEDEYYIVEVVSLVQRNQKNVNYVLDQIQRKREVIESHQRELFNLERIAAASSVLIEEVRK